MLGAAVEQRGHSADDSGTHQDEAQDLLHTCRRSQATHVQGEQQERTNHANDDGGQMDAGARHIVEGFTVGQPRDQIPQNVGDLNGFPRNDGYEPAKGRPAGNHGDLVIKRTECECHAAAGDGQGGNQFAVAQRDGNHHDQCCDVTETGRNGAATAAHPVVDGDGPADSHDCAKANAEKVNSAYAFFLSLITHTFYLVSC